MPTAVMSATGSGFPLTPVERRLWLAHHLFVGAPVCHIGRVVRLRGKLDVAAWVRAFDTVASHPALRLRVREVGGEPRGGFGGPAHLEVVDGGTAGDVDRATAEIVLAPWDLSSDMPLLRGRLVRVYDDEHVLVLGAHHVLLDGWGLSRSVPRALARALRGEDLDIDEGRWLARRAAQATAAAPAADTVEQWRRDLRGAPPLQLPFVHTRPERASGRSWHATVPLPEALLTRVRVFARSQAAQPVHVWLAAFMVELARAARTHDVTLSTPHASRLGPGGEEAFGCLVRNKAVRATLAEDEPFTAVVARAGTALGVALGAGGVDAEDVLAIPGPLFNFIPLPAFDAGIAGVEIDARRVIAGGTTVPLALTVEATAASRLVVEADADVFDAGFPARLADRFLAVLDDALSRPATAWARLRRLGPQDREAIARNAPTAAESALVTGGHLVPLLRRDLAGAAPALVQIRDPSDPRQDVVIARAALLDRVERIASSLRASDRPFVGVRCVDPAREIEGILGVLFARAAYVPIDPRGAPQAVASITSQAELTLILDDDEVERRARSTPGARPATTEDPRSPAYAIFTSGSTGPPKGVVVSHDAVVSQIQAREALGYPHFHTALLLAPFIFDGSVETLFWILTTGGTLFLLDEDARRDPRAARLALANRPIHYASTVPAMWNAILGARGESLSSALDFVIVGGEQLTRSLVEKHRAATGATLVNEYGPTETTVFATAWFAPPRDEPVPDVVPIGRSVGHVRCSVVDERLEPVPVLEPGELIVSGRGLAEGYLGQPELTARVFIDGEPRFYRTGDLVRLHVDGQLEWLARSDDQVKILGVRVEPGAVEAALLAAGAAEAAVVVVEQRLHAWVTPASLQEATVIERLREHLPAAMIPVRITPIDALPLTGTGKIDRRALSARLHHDTEDILPATSMERLIASVWEEVLERRPIGVTRSFFAYGGDSLKAVIVVERLSQTLGTRVALSSLMAARDVRTLAQYIARQQSDVASPLVMPLGPRRAERPRVLFLPGIGGHVVTFAGIADRLTAPSAGLRCWGTEPGEEPLPSVEALARKNTEALDAAGVGPGVVLAGYSFGGLVACEMALQLEAAGRPPRALAILDTLAPGYPKKPPLWTRAHAHLTALLERDWSGRADYLKTRLESLELKLNVRLGRASAFAHVATRSPEIAALDPQARARLERLAGISTLAHYRYRPRARTSVPVLVFSARSGVHWAAMVMDDPLLGWREWTTGAVFHVEVQGDHRGIFVPENVEAMASALDALFAPNSRS